MNTHRHKKFYTKLRLADCKHYRTSSNINYLCGSIVSLASHLFKRYEIILNKKKCNTKNDPCSSVETRFDLKLIVLVRSQFLTRLLQ